VSLQCTERGVMIEKIWDAYLNLFEKLIAESNRKQREIEGEHLQEIKRI